VTLPTSKGSTWGDKHSAPCCHKYGCSSKHGYGIETVKNIATGYYKLSTINKRAYLANRVVAKQGEKTRLYFLEENVTTRNFQIAANPQDPKPVCSKFFYWCTRASTNKVFQPSLRGADAWTGPSPVLINKISPVNRPAKFRMDIRTWLLVLATYYMISPDSQYTYLPFANKDDVFTLYDNESSTGASPTYFKQTWREDVTLDLIRIRRYLRFAKCDECTTNLEDSHKTHDRAERKVLLTKHRKHLRFVTGERDSYYKRRAMARQNPDEYMSLIIDGSDTSWYHFPYFKRTSHSSQNKWKIGIHVMGCINHGRGASIVTYVDNVKQGTNVTVEVLHQELMKTMKNEGKLPKTLFLQLDNTTKQCKSKYVMGYLARLVRDGVFDEVIVSFLPVGHTHEDIDQLFSRIAVYLRHHNCLSRHHLTDAAALAFVSDQERPTITHMDRVANMSDYLHPYLRDLDGITKYHQFKISYIHDDTSSTKRAIRLRARVWIACKDDTSRWMGIANFTRDTLIFKSDNVTKTWLNAVPFSGEAVPASQRKQKKISADGSLLGDRARLIKDVESMINARDVPSLHAEDLRECLTLITDPPEDPRIPLPFVWNTEIYTAAHHKLRQKPAADRRKRAEQRCRQLKQECTIGLPAMVRGNGEANPKVSFWLGKVTATPRVEKDEHGEWDAFINVRWYKAKEDFGRYKLMTGRGIENTATLPYGSVQHFFKWDLTKDGTISKNTDYKSVKYYADSWAEEGFQDQKGNNEENPAPEPEGAVDPGDRAHQRHKTEARARLLQLDLNQLVQTYITRAGPSELKFLDDTMDATLDGREDTHHWEPHQRHQLTIALSKRKAGDHYRAKLDLAKKHKT
jgi:hypothetical protein